MKKIKTLCGVLALLCVGMMPVSAQNVLKFNADKKFKIVQFTDVHWQQSKDYYTTHSCSWPDVYLQSPDDNNARPTPFHLHHFPSITKWYTYDFSVHIHNVDNWENIPCYKKDWLIK